MREGDEETDIDKLPIDLLAQIFSLFTSVKDLAQASCACKKWREGVKESLARRDRLGFSGWKLDDESTRRLALLANNYNLEELYLFRDLLHDNTLESVVQPKETLLNDESVHAYPARIVWFSILFIIIIIIITMKCLCT